MNHNHSPVFIVGPVRSGSTMLLLMLDSHPNIKNPGECDFLFDMVSDSCKFPSNKDYIEWLSVNRIFQDKHLKVGTELSYIEQINYFIEQFNSPDKVLTINVHRHFHRIACVFPDARYIHLLRDPRDVARSTIGMGWAGHVYYGIDIWKKAELSWDNLRSTLNINQYIEIKYEDLLEDTEKGLTSICNFIGLEYSQQMLGYSKKSTFKAPDKNLGFQWKTKYSKRELQLVEDKVSDLLLKRGYELSGFHPLKPGILERIVLLVQNKAYLVRFKINKYGLGLYLENYLANRIGFIAWRNRCQERINVIDRSRLK